MTLAFGDVDRAGSDFLVCAMFTESHIEMARRLAQSLGSLDISHSIFQVPFVHSSTTPKGEKDAVYAKANFILHVLEKTERPVLYVDCDCVVLKYPTLINEIISQGCDFAIFNWLTSERSDAYAPYRLPLEGSELKRYYGYSHQYDLLSNDQLVCSGAVQFWGQTESAKHLLTSWRETVQNNPLTPDDISLDFTFNNDLSHFHKSLKPYWLPKNYVRYPFWIFDEPTISHPDFPLVIHEWKDIDDAAGRMRFYPARMQLKEKKYHIEPGYFLDTYTGDILNQRGDHFVIVGSVKAKYWL